MPYKVCAECHEALGSNAKTCPKCEDHSDGHDKLLWDRGTTSCDSDDCWICGEYDPPDGWQDFTGADHSPEAMGKLRRLKR